MSRDQVWLITGASSGFGREMTELVLKRGDIAVATARKPETLDDLKTKKSKIHSRRSRKHLEGLTSPSTMQVAVSQERLKSLPKMLLTRCATLTFREPLELNHPLGGRLIVTSSRSGVRAVPGIGFYSASKHGTRSRMEYRGFCNESIAKLVAKTHTYPAYTKLILPIIAIFASLGDDKPRGSGRSMAVQKIYDLAAEPGSSLRLPLKKTTVQAFTGEVESVLEAAAKSES
ncbi:unnamed protein product [Somion occarium]|uniref:Uncharacterized protein n=1 Tax=Somion occarium TaxID=3059160 RepID=A0ABP1E0U5_9APHY